ncbi:MAG: 8-amino-7-oxononanoate synthase [Thermogutta sp.]
MNFGSNDYLGLAGDSRLVDAVRRAMVEEGFGGGASPLICGRSSLHDALESALARFEGTEAAIVFSSGYSANSGTIAALVGPGDAVYTDEKNHASIWDGCRLSRADVKVYRHGDADHLAALLAKPHRHRRRLIVTDTVFSMDGDLAPLSQLAEVASQFGTMLMADEAHATGVFGELGRGLCEAYGVEDRVPIRVGTLSKALGGVGGFTAGCRLLTSWLFQRARSYVFSTAFPAALCAAAMTALDIVRAEPHARRKLLERAETVRDVLRGQGWNVGRSQSQIIPIIVGDARTAMELSAALWDAGFFVPAIRPPTVPKGEACLRLSLTTVHEDGDVARFLQSLEKVRDRFLLRR